MKTITRSILFVSIAALLALSSCNKDDDPTKSKTDLLTQNTWKYSSGTSTDATTQSFLVLLTGSEYTFKKDGTYSATTALGSSSGKWEFASSETHIIQDKGTTDEVDYEIKKLDESNLEIAQKDGNITTTLKWVKK